MTKNAQELPVFARGNTDVESRGPMAYITKQVSIGLDEIVGLTLEEFLDRLSELAIGSELLMDINYRAIGVNTDGTLVLEVTGDPSADLEEQ